MEQPAQTTQPAVGFNCTDQRAYAAPTNLPAEAVTDAPAYGTIPSPFPVDHQHPFAHIQVPQFHHPRQQQLLQEFWCNQMLEIQQTTDYKSHSLPLKRIWNIMRADEDVRMISSDAPVVLAKACKMFIQELTLRSWFLTEERYRKTLQKKDIAGAILRSEIFDFLQDVVPTDEVTEESARIPTDVGVPGEQMPHCYVPAHADRATAAVDYEGEDPPPMTFVSYQQAPAQAQGAATQEAATAAASSSDA